MLGYLGRRLAFLVPMLLGITVVSFGLMHLAPGSPTDLYTEFNPRAGTEFRERFEAYYGLDKPLPVQYWRIRLKPASLRAVGPPWTSTSSGGGSAGGE